MMMMNTQLAQKLNLSGGNLAGNINLVNSHKIINSPDPTSDKDLVTKKYMETHVNNSHVSGTTKYNPFDYVMLNPTSNLTEEDDITLGNALYYVSSPHLFNKKVIDAKLLLDSSKGYYSSRLGVNLYPLPNTSCTMAFEIIWTDNNIDRNTISLHGVSSIETIHNISTKTFNEYAKLIVQFTKSQNIGNNYIYIDIVMKMKSGSLYPSQTQVYLIVYGTYDLQPDVPSDIYDSMWTVRNNKILINGDIDMGNKTIIGIKEDTVDSGAVNYKQLQAYISSLELKLEKMINNNKSYYNQVFLYYFACLDPDQYDVNKSFSGALIEKINGRLIIKNPIDLNTADIKNGLNLNGSYIHLDDTYDKDSDFTMFITFKHDTSNTRNNSFGFGSLNGNLIQLIYPNIKMKADKFYLSETVSKNYSETMYSYYKNKQLMLWFAKSDDFYEVNLCDNGGLISESLSVGQFTSDKMVIASDYKIQRIGFSPIYHAVNNSEFHKILLMEKSRGTFFQ